MVKILWQRTVVRDGCTTLSPISAYGAAFIGLLFFVVRLMSLRTVE